MSYHIVSIDSANCSLSCRDGQLTCKTAEGERKLPLEDVVSIIITTFSASIHSNLFLEAAKHGVALIICEAFKPVSLVLPANRSTDTLLTRAVLNLPDKSRLQLWQRTVDAKCENQVALAEFIAPGNARLMRFSVYARACVSFARQETHIERLKKNLPLEGSVRAIFVPRAQWEKSYVIQGSPASETEAEDIPEQIQLW